MSRPCTCRFPRKGTKFAVYKVTKRRDEDITAALGAFFLTLAKDGTVADVRIAYGGMAATPKRASAVEHALIGKPWTEETVETAMAEYARDFTPLTDMRASAEYRALAAAQSAVALLCRDRRRHQSADPGLATRGGLMNKHATSNLKASEDRWRRRHRPAP